MKNYSVECDLFEIGKKNFIMEKIKEKLYVFKGNNFWFLDVWRFFVILRDFMYLVWLVVSFLEDNLSEVKKRLFW